MAEFEGFLLRRLLKGKHTLNISLIDKISKTTNNIFVVSYSIQATISIFFWVILYPLIILVSKSKESFELPPSLIDEFIKNKSGGGAEISLLSNIALHGGIWAL